MVKFVCFMCGVAEMAALGASISLRLSLGVSVVLLAIPWMLLLWAWMLSVRSRRVRVRKSQVYVYVPPEQRRYPGQAFRPYVEPELYQSSQLHQSRPQQSSQQYEEVW